MKTIDPYTWDDTPDLTTAWSDSGAMPTMFLLGDLDGTNQW